MLAVKAFYETPPLAEPVVSETNERESIMNKLRIVTQEDCASQLRTAIQIALEKIYNNHPGNKRYTWLEKFRLVSQLKKLYRATPKERRGDELIPFHSKTVVSIRKSEQDEENTAEYYLEYKWNGWNSNDAGSSALKYAEFVEGTYQIKTVIPKGTLFDRVGGSDGSYLCPIPCSEQRDVYSVQERAIPYLFEEVHITNEPAYHRYIATCDISRQLLMQKIKEKSKFYSLNAAAINYAEELVQLDIVEGYIAPVKPFGKQGLGGGYQYKMPIPIKHLLLMGVLKEVRAQ